jgi:hypothetical protein
MATVTRAAWGPAMTVGDKRLARATALRDLALQAIRARGAWEKAGPTNLMMLRDGEIMVSYRTPFQRLPQLSQKTRYYLALLGGPKPLPFGLDLWHRRKKALGIEWDEDGPVALVSFSPGDWEAELEQLVAPST